MEAFFVHPDSPDPVAEFARFYGLSAADLKEIRRAVARDKSGDRTLAIALCARRAHQLEQERQERESRVIRNPNSYAIPVFGEGGDG